MRKQVITAAALIAVLLIGLAIGRWSSTGGGLTPNKTGAMERDILYWVAPMDPNYRRDEPGKSPMGMDLVAVYADEADAVPGTVKINPALVNNLGVRTTRAEIGTLSRRIETVGYIGYDEDTLQHVHTRVDGWIEKLATTATGDPVKKGQLLFELYSPTLVNAQQEYLAALRSSNSALRSASRDRLAALGVTGSEIARLEKERTASQRVRVYAEADGVIAHLGVREGIFVTPATEVMSVARLDRVWVIAEVFERQAAWVEPGQIAEVELDYVPGQRWQGTVDYVYPELDAVDAHAQGSHPFRQRGRSTAAEHVRARHLACRRDGTGRARSSGSADTWRQRRPRRAVARWWTLQGASRRNRHRIGYARCDS